ncbi:MAG: phosphatidylserine/phosphatidylglycerophosphate/cardiolipin synthase family protein [Mariprofundus sp.]
MTDRNPYPEREGNDFKLLAGAETFLPVMELAIHRAKRFVLFEQYLFSSGRVADRFIDALVACAQRGVQVYMLIDHFGARAFNHADRTRITKAGIALLFYNPAYLIRFFQGLPRNHRKVMLIDGTLAFTGGAGIADEYQSTKTAPAWHDLVIAMSGPIVTDWQQQFVQTWQHWQGTIELPATMITAAGGQSGRLSPSRRGLHKFTRQSLLQQINQATDHIWLGTAYWLPSRRMLRALRSATQRGVEVRLLLPGPINDHPTVYHAGRRYYHFLLRHGVRIFEYQPAFMHAKLYLCDSFCSVGSCNMDRWGLRWNLEANLESHDSALKAEAEAFFQAAFAHSREITLDTWLQRPLKNRISEWMLGYLDLVIERYGVNRDLRKQGSDPER